MTALLVQTGASLVAVLFVAWLVGRLGLGADPRIEDAAHAIRLAEEAEAGFRGIEVARDVGFFLTELVVLDFIATKWVRRTKPNARAPADAGADHEDAYPYWWL